MPKGVRGKSKDPIQQKLRDHKRRWSDNTSALISKIIAFKRGLNGRGDARTGISPSNIKDPLPGEVNTVLNQLTSDFQRMVEDASSIISEQAQYAQTRKKKAPKAPAPSGVSVAPENKVVETLSRIGSVNDGAKIASTKLSRFWQYLTGIFSRKQFNRQRIGLLSRTADLYNALLDFENDVLTINIKSIPNAVSKYRKFKDDFNIFMGTLESVVQMIAKSVGMQEELEKEKSKEEAVKEEVSNETKESTPVEKEKVQPEQSNFTEEQIINKINTDIRLLFNVGLTKEPAIKINTMISELKKEEDPNIRTLFLDRIKEAYENLVKSIANDIQKKYGPVNFNSVQDLVNIVKKNTRVAPKEEPIPEEDGNDAFEIKIAKLAHNPLTRFLKRDLIKSIPFNETASVRLEIVEIVDNVKSLLKRLMNTLEKDLSIEEANVLLKDISEQLELIKKPMHILNLFYMRDYFSKSRETKDLPKGKKKEQDPFFDFLARRRIRKDLSEDIF